MTRGLKNSKLEVNDESAPRVEMKNSKLPLDVLGFPPYVGMKNRLPNDEVPPYVRMKSSKLQLGCMRPKLKKDLQLQHNKISKGLPYLIDLNYSILCRV